MAHDLVGNEADLRGCEPRTAEETSTVPTTYCLRSSPYLPVLQCLTQGPLIPVVFPPCLSLSLFPGTHSIRIDGDMLAGMRYITPRLLFLAMTTGGQMTRHHKRDRGRKIHRLDDNVCFLVLLYPPEDDQQVCDVTNKGIVL